MRSLGESFNRSGLSRFLNMRAGRIFRVVMGIGFIALGVAYRDHLLGVVSIVWGALAFIAGAFDVCFISAALGGPLPGREVRGKYQTD
jgi:hypothetical protein